MSRKYAYGNNGLLSSGTTPRGKTVQYMYDAYSTTTGLDFKKGDISWNSDPKDFYHYSTEYGPDLQRVRSSLYKNGQPLYSKFYWDDYEEKTVYNTTYLYWYVNGADGLAGIMLGNAQNGSWSRNLVAITDHLGSIMALMDNYDTYYSCSYDAWGNRTIGMESTPVFDRGFCGHEHIDEIGLINMNGRMYDPKLSRFLSPDPYVQSPANPQNFNRYSYCLNNPLRYTDPDGEFFTAIAFIISPALLPIGISMDIGWMSGAQKANHYEDMPFCEGAYKGLLTGALGGALSMVGGGTLVANMLWGSAEGAITGVFDAAIWGENVKDAFFKGMAYGASFALLSSQNLRNFVRGKGFNNNKRVFDNFKNGKYIIPDGVDWQQACLDYFSFSGTYDPYITSHVFQGDSYYGVTNPKTGDISYGDLAYDNYPTLYGTNIKESYHSTKILNGIPTEQIPADLQGMNLDYYLEEIYGYIHTYKNQGLFIGCNEKMLSGVSFYQTQLEMLEVSYPIYPSRFLWLYKIPRRW